MDEVIERVGKIGFPLDAKRALCLVDRMHRRSAL